MAIFHCVSLIFGSTMIAFLQGNFVQLTPAKLIVDVGGVGYEVNISLNTYESISGKEKGLLHTYLHLTENSQVLFGFFGQDEKELFMQLISVSGVGASTALMVLSYQEGNKKVEQNNAIDALWIVSNEGGGFEHYSSSGFIK